MSGPTTVALQSLAFSGLDDDQFGQLVETVTPAHYPMEFRRYDPAEAFDVIASSTTTPRMVKLAVLQHWRTSRLHERVPPDHPSIRRLAASVISPEHLHGTGDSESIEVEPLLDALDLYASNISDLDSPDDSVSGGEYARLVYEESKALVHHTADFIAYEDHERPPPACHPWVTDGVVCFEAYFEVPNATIEDLKPLTNPTTWPKCGAGFWLSVRRVDHLAVYKEHAELMPGWYEWVTLGTDRDDTAEQYCLRYWCLASPNIEINQGFLSVRDDGHGGVAVTMRKCLLWENELIQAMLGAVQQELCKIMLSHLQGMANQCRIDQSTATGVTP